jgi:hypothetical protein
LQTSGDFGNLWEVPGAAVSVLSQWCVTGLLHFDGVTLLLLFLL